MIYDIAIIGAGASGLMLSSLIKNKKIILLEANDKIGKKIKISGGGKCNITNSHINSHNYLINNELFIKNILNNFTNEDLLKFLNKNNVYPKIDERLVKGTYFCDSSSLIISMFYKLISHINLQLNQVVIDVSYKNEFIINTNKNIFKSKKVIIASGGLSYTNLGASCIAFDIAKKFGHTIKTLNPALVGFTVQKEQFWFKLLSGLSLKVEIKIGKKIFNGGFLFTHKGCSGPVILNSSLYWSKGDIQIDFIPNIKNISNLFNSHKFISSSFNLPKRFIIEFLKSINLEDKAMNKLTIDEKKRLSIIKKYKFSPAGNFGYKKAEVTKGGINTYEIDDNMQSKLKKNLYFIGECLDITGELGGYNFQSAFSSAFVCSKDLI